MDERTFGELVEIYGKMKEVDTRINFLMKYGTTNGGESEQCCEKLRKIIKRHSNLSHLDDSQKDDFFDAVMNGDLSPKERTKVLYDFGTSKEVRAPESDIIADICVETED